jgi:hypothetical protein
VAARSQMLTIFVRSNIGIVGSNPTLGMDVYPRFTVLCCTVGRQRPFVGPVVRPRSPTNSPNRFTVSENNF